MEKEFLQGPGNWAEDFAASPSTSCRQRCSLTALEALRNQEQPGRCVTINNQISGISVDL
jgi:hypothetical protein